LWDNYTETEFMKKDKRICDSLEENERNAIVHKKIRGSEYNFGAEIYIMKEEWIEKGS